MRRYPRTASLIGPFWPSARTSPVAVACCNATPATAQHGTKLLPPSAYLALNFRDAAPPSPRGVLANATPRRFPLRLITRNLSSAYDLRPSAAFPNQP